MFLDAGLMWLIGIPMAFLAANVLHIQDIALFFLIMQIEPAVRLVIGMRRYWKRTWIRNLTDEIRKGSSTTTPAS
jgi:Na+-driven multidrug efflux pump